MASTWTLHSSPGWPPTSRRRGENLFRLQRQPDRGDATPPTGAVSDADIPASPLGLLQMLLCGMASVIGVGLFVGVGHVANQVAGPAIISSLIIAAVSSLLSGLCYAEFQTRQSLLADTVYSCFYQTIGEFPAFVVGWCLILQHVTGMAATGRALSALIDYISDHSLYNFWLQKLGRIPLLNTHPDFVAFSFVLLSTLPFGFGLKWPRRLNFILSGGAVVVAILFVAIGARHVDSKGWAAHGFLPYESTGLLSGAAICACAFSGHYAVMTKMKSVKRPERCIPLVMGGTLTVCFIIYFAVATILTLMVHHKKMDSDVPLVQAFEIRDVSWARFLIGFGEAFCLILTLLSVSHTMYISVVALAVDGLIFKCCARRCSPCAAKSSMVPALVFGSVSAIFALVFSMATLLEVMALAPLVVNTLVCNCVLHLRYQPDDPYRYEPLAPDADSDIETPDSTLPCSPIPDGSPKTISNVMDIRINKQEIFPLVKQTSLTTQSPDSSDAEADDVDHETVGEPLLELSPLEHPLLDSDDDVSSESGYEKGSSDTDIDAIVEEYKEKIRVATLTGPGGAANRKSRFPTAATGRRVGFSVAGLTVSFLVVSLTLVLGNEALANGSPMAVAPLCVLLSIVIGLLIVIVRQPQNLHGLASPRRPLTYNVFRVPLLPWIPAIAAFLNVCLLTNVLRKQWVPFSLWIIAGFLIYFLYGVWNSAAAKQSHRTQTAEKIKLQPLPRQMFLSSVLPIHNQNVDSTRRITQVDTILIAR